MKLTTIISAFYLLCLLCIQPVHADGGFWLPTQIQGKVHQAMKKQGLRLSERDVYKRQIFTTSTSRVCRMLPFH